MVSATNYERANLLRVGNLRTYEHISIYDEFKESVIVSILLPPRNRDLVTKGCLHRILRWAGVVWRRGDVSGIHCLSPTSTTPEATRHQATRGEEQNNILQNIFNVLMSLTIKQDKIQTSHQRRGAEQYFAKTDHKIFFVNSSWFFGSANSARWGVSGGWDVRINFEHFGEQVGIYMYTSFCSYCLQYFKGQF